MSIGFNKSITPDEVEKTGSIADLFLRSLRECEPSAKGDGFLVFDLPTVNVPVPPEQSADGEKVREDERASQDDPLKEIEGVTFEICSDPAGFAAHLLRLLPRMLSIKAKYRFHLRVELVKEAGPQ